MKTKKEILIELSPKNVHFIIDKLEQVYLNDIILNNESAKKKLHRNLTDDFEEWFDQKYKLKEQKKINIKGRPRCFIGKTEVLTSKGYKQIKDIEKGEFVYSLNEKTKKLELKEVIKTYRFDKKKHKLIKFINKFGFEIISTYGHKFYFNGKWIPNQYLYFRVLENNQKYKKQIFNFKSRKNKNYELEKYQTNKNNESCKRSKWIFKNNDIFKRAESNNKNSPNSGPNIFKKSPQKTPSKSQKQQSFRQSFNKFGMEHTQRKYKPHDETKQTNEKLRDKKWTIKTYNESSKRNKKKIYSTKIHISKIDERIQSFKRYNKKNCLQSIVFGREINLNDLNKIETYFEDIPVYDLEVKDNHNFLITKENIIVHNSGKSLIGLKIVKKSCDQKGIKFTVSDCVCSNQSEFKKKLNDKVYGQNYLVDENAFSNVGEGSMTELKQITDINNIIAKNNNDIVYITPRIFLNTGAEYSLQFYAKDIKNWLSKFLLFNTSQTTPILLGYVIFNVGTLFQETGCFIYSKTGGCTNPNRLKKEDIEEDYIINSDCVPKEYESSKLVCDGSACPFYNVCESQMQKYETKKDKWIEREMKGGLSERERERYELSLKLFQQLYNEEEEKFNAKNKAELMNKIKLKLPFMSNSKFTISESKEISEFTMLLKDESSFNDVCRALDLNMTEERQKIGKV